MFDLDSAAREFNKAFGIGKDRSTTYPVLSPDQRVAFVRVIAEEVAEYAIAMGVRLCLHAEPAYEDLGSGRALPSSMSFNVSEVHGGVTDMVECADALADIIYASATAAEAHGFPTDKLLEEVHRSNMTKLGPEGKALRDAYGKVMKGPIYSPPNIAKVLGDNLMGAEVVKAGVGYIGEVPKDGNDAYPAN
jgi:hypothetical protein